MLERFGSGRAQLRIILQVGGEQINTVLVKPGRQLSKTTLTKRLESRQVKSQKLTICRDARQARLVRTAECLEDQQQLVLDLGPGKQGLATNHLIEDAANATHVNVGGVVGGAEQNIRRPVPVINEKLIINNRT